MVRRARGGREAESARPGWLATLLGAGILVVLGFGIGLVTGAAYEEPDLVMDHLAGRTVDVPLVTPDVGGEPASESPSEAIAPEQRPLGAPQVPSTAKAAPEAEAVPAPAVAAAPPPAVGRGFAIQVGAFGGEAAAQQLVSELKAAGHPSYVAAEGGGARFKVRVGPLESRAQAEQVATRLQREQRLPTWILSR